MEPDEPSSMRTGTCFITTGDRFEQYKYDVCLKEVSGKRNYLLIGDSHSAMLWPALAAALRDANVMQELAPLPASRRSVLLALTTAAR